MDITALKPEKKLKVMDLVSLAGIDVSDWQNFKGGKEKAAANPKYCYEWSHKDIHKNLVVLSLWYKNLELVEGRIIQKLNLRLNIKQTSRSSPQRLRAKKMDESLETAARLSWAVRVIICDGHYKDKTSKTSITTKRALDPERWYVEHYDHATGECLLVRGRIANIYIDQFHLEVETASHTKQKEHLSLVYQRSPQLRAEVLLRAKGRCELCGAQGFKTSSGSTYLETHHIQPLSEHGKDTIENVIALCPNHHREAHFGKNHAQLKIAMLNLVKGLMTLA